MVSGRAQNTYTAKQFTGVEGSTVPIKETIESFQMICRGDVDHIPEQAFYNIGGMDDVMRLGISVSGAGLLAGGGGGGA